MGVKVTNNGYATISAGITSTDTTITLDSGQGARFPTLGSGDFFFGTLVDTSNNIEIVKVTARSSDSMTVVRGQDNTTARAFAIGDRFELRPTAALFESIPYDNNTTSTGSLALPVGTTAQQPSASTTKGHIRFDDDNDVIYYSDGVSWIKISSAVPTLTSVTGNLFAGATSTLTLAGSNFLTTNLVVNFVQSSDAINENVTVTPASDSSATVTVPSAVYSNVTAGNVVTIKVTNSDSVESGTQTVTATALPSGGSISNSGGYRIHTFNSSGTFVNTINNLSVEWLVIAGGGAGGGTAGTYGGGGGGAGGYRTSVSGQTSGGNTSAESASTVTAASHTITVGAGGSYSNGGDGGNGGNSSFGSYVTSTGGGGGDGNMSGAGASGGSGGGRGGTATGASGGSGTSGQGFAGGGNDGSGTGGGGGGAGQAGFDDATLSTSGDGGDGLSNNITGSSVTRAGGGGGGDRAGDTSQTYGRGGSGGGGDGASDYNSTNGVAGTANTGSGGGGGSADNRVGAAGGSGVVILRYQL